MIEELPKATHTGELKIGDLTIPCAVLDDGTRLISERGIIKALGEKEVDHIGAEKRRLEKAPIYQFLPLPTI